MKEEDIKKIVRDGYATIARQGCGCCGPTGSCCGGTDLTREISQDIGYTEEDINAAPEGANLGLGCGNPVALASLKEGETVLDLGSGAGFDCFLAAQKVGEKGHVIGVDMTPEMVERARENASKGDFSNMEFRLGEIENLPVADNTIDTIISNCVINLAPDKRRVFNEAYRVLKPGGRLMVSDMVLLKELPAFIKNTAAAYIGCLSGAVMKEEYLKSIAAAGFQEVMIVDETPLKWIANDSVTNMFADNLVIPPEKVNEVASSVTSIKVCGVKPEPAV